MTIAFKPSINSKFDIGKSILLDNYIPTETHINVFKSIFFDINNRSNKHSHLIIGPYGTGKSYLVTLIAGILSRAYIPGELSLFLERISNLSEDQDVIREIQAFIDSDYKYIPILINGNEGSFTQTILNRIYDVLPIYFDDFIAPGIPLTIIDTIDRWKNSYPKAYEQYLNQVYNQNINPESFIKDIKAENPRAINVFQNIYREITYGEELAVSETQIPFIPTIEYVLQKLKERNLGILIVYDEFGRYLQSLQAENLNGVMQDIQDLSELANNGLDNLELVLVSHKSLDSYFINESDNTREEFRRIEGRFETHLVQSDQNVFATLVSERISQLNIRSAISEETILYYLQQLRIYDLYELSPNALEKLIIRGSYPFHPVSLYLLSVISNVFGQNERTLFTFLDTNEPSGFKSFLEENEGILYPSYLYPYFFSNQTSRISPKQDLVQKSLKTLENSNSDLDLNRLVSIYQFIALWELAELQDKQKLDIPFISFSTGISTDLESYLHYLEESKLIRYNYRKNAYELTEGSSIDIDAEINKLLIDHNYDSVAVEQFLLGFLPRKYEKASLYNEKKKMIRFANISFHIPNNDEDIITKKNLQSDASIIIYVINKKLVNKLRLKESLLNSNNQEVLSYLSSIDYQRIQYLYNRYSALNYLRNNPEFIRQDSKLPDELDYQIDLIKFSVEEQLRQLINGSFSDMWIIRNNIIQITNRYELQLFLSDLFESLYPNTPIIINDLLNKSNIPGIQKKALIHVIESILTDKAIVGHGPDYLAYYSILEANGYENLLAGQHSSLEKLQTDLEGKLRKSNKLSDIIDFFSSPKYGYGLRQPIIPVLFTALLKPMWNNIMFYGNGSFLMNLNAEKIYEMFSKPDGITYEYHHYSKDQLNIINQIIYLFGTRPEDADKPLHLKAGWAIYSWLKSLPKYSQITFETSEAIIQLRDAINYFSINPINSLDLLSAIGIESISNLRIQLESIVIVKKNALLQWIYSLFSVSNKSELRQLLVTADLEYKLKNPVIKSLLKDDSFDLIEELSNALLGINVNDWSDNTNEVFKREFTKYFNQWKYHSLSKDEVITITIDGEEKAIDRITDLSQQAKNLSQRLRAMVTAQNQRVSHDEISYILYELFKESV